MKGLVAFLSPIVAVLLLVGLLYRTSTPPRCLPTFKPTLAASAKDGMVTLNWRVAVRKQLSIERWQYQQYVRGEGTASVHDVRPAVDAEGSYIVRDLMNGITYMFRVQAILKSGKFSCWSDWVPATPRRPSALMERIEKHQQATADNTAKIVLGLAGIAAQLDETRVRKGGKERSGSRGGNSGDDRNDGDANGGNDGGDGYDADDPTGGEVGAGKGCAKAVHPVVPIDPPARCHTLLHGLRFGENSYVLGEQNECAINNIVEDLRTRKDGLVLTEGYATSVGGAVYNLHLSDMRAACTSLCLRARIPPGRKFAFREIARGEVLNASELAGTGDAGQRVKVMFCEGQSLVPDAREDRRAWPTIEECGCP